MIFVMIAGSYIPFIIGVLRPQLGVPLCAIVWGLAAIGIALKLLCPYGGERAFLGLYLGMGWLVLGVLRPLLMVLPGPVLLLLLLGGLVYSLGALVHARDSMPFHNALWHAEGPRLFSCCLAPTLSPSGWGSPGEKESARGPHDRQWHHGKGGAGRIIRR
jgi:hypothetical protein